MIQSPAVRPLTLLTGASRFLSSCTRQPLRARRSSPFGPGVIGTTTAAAPVVGPVSKATSRRFSGGPNPPKHQQGTKSNQAENRNSGLQASKPEQQTEQQLTGSIPKSSRRATRRTRDTAPKHLPATDLRNVHGVGPKNEQLLLKVGLFDVASLKDKYKTEHKENTGELKQYLQETVGIRSHHCNFIAADIKHKVDEEVEEAGGPSTTGRSKRVTLCVEGNISAGKSTFLKWVSQGNPELREMLEVVPEPVDKWQDVGTGHHNVLDAFYKSPERFAYTFQNYVFVTRMMQERETQVGDRPFRLLERSVFSDRMVFVRTVHEKQWMSDLELNIYDSWFEPVVQASPSLIPDGFIYLRATPDICMGRMKRRSRQEEVGVDVEYLQGLHQKHEDWLRFPPPAAVDWRNRSGETLPEKLRNGGRDLRVGAYAEPRAIQGKVLYLNSSSLPGMPSFIDGVPTLVLDYDKEIDMVNDHEARNEYATQVKAYFDFVKGLINKKKEDLRLAAITGELGLGNVREASDDQVRAVQHALALEGVGLSPRHLDAIRNSLTKTLVNPSGRPAQSIPMLAGAI
ncbi:hypothetical protein ABBQ38_010291 [Trebouxia sp. C0009 RCD-2024]